MGLFSKKSASEQDESRERTTALVVSADAPPLGAPFSGSYAHGTIRVVVDTPAAPHRQLTATFRYADDHWLVAGMDVPILLDPLHPDSFEVDWANVPTMQQQVEANNPAIADPFAASRRVAQALGITPSEKTAAQYERFQKAVAEAGSKPAPVGARRAVATLASVRGRFESSGDDDGGATRSGVSLMRDSPAVLSVVVPGEPPYAAYLSKFKVPRNHLVIPGDPMEVLVTTADPQGVEILWADMPGVGEQIAARMGDATSANAKLLAAMSEQMQAATAAATAAPAGTPMAATGMPPQMRQMLVDTLKRSLINVNDPARRQQMLDQYKAMGLEITPEELN
ncbi:MAG: hypothetical protein ABIO06_07495 [Pseudolysinimonas sp.]